MPIWYIPFYPNMTPLFKVLLYTETCNYTWTNRAYTIPKPLYPLSHSYIRYLFILKHTIKRSMMIPCTPNNQHVGRIHSVKSINVTMCVCFEKSCKSRDQASYGVSRMIYGATVRPCTNLRPNWVASRIGKRSQRLHTTYKLGVVQCYFSIWPPCFFSDPIHFITLLNGFFVLLS